MLSWIEGRVLGCLLEKERTVPDQYPMSLNTLVLACNQATNREPVLSLESHEVEVAVTSLKAHGLARLVHPTHGRGVVKYRQVLEEKLALDPAEAAVLTLLLLRGPQTSGELRTRSERLHHFDTPADVEAVLAKLADRGEPMVRHLDRQPGQKEARWQQILADEVAPAVGSVIAGVVGDDAVPSVSLPVRVAQLEDRVARLEAALADLLPDETPASADG